MDEGKYETSKKRMKRMKRSGSGDIRRNPVR